MEHPNAVPGGSTPHEARARSSARIEAGRSDGQSRVDRPAPPHDWRFWVERRRPRAVIVGWGSCRCVFAFVAYQLWGTGIQQAQAQNDLKSEFAELEAQLATTSTNATTTVPPSTHSGHRSGDGGRFSHDPRTDDRAARVDGALDDLRPCTAADRRG